MTDSSSPVLLTVESGLARIRFNRPAALNAIDEPLAQAFLAACEALARRDDVRAVMLSGEGKAFMAGGDLARFQADMAQAPETVKGIIGPLHAALLILTRLRAPVVASVHGAVAGAGLSLTLACDLAVAASNARFAVAYCHIGASPDASMTWSLPRVVGLRKALELTLTGQSLDAQQALQTGLVNKVVAPELLEQESLQLARQLAQGATAALGRTKQLLRESLGRSMEEQLGAEEASFRACAGTQDFAEGVTAFFEKRKPQFQGG